MAWFAIYLMKSFKMHTCTVIISVQKINENNFYTFKVKIRKDENLLIIGDC